MAKSWVPGGAGSLRGGHSLDRTQKGRRQEVGGPHAPHLGLSCSASHGPIWAPHTDSSPLGRLGRQQPLLGVPTTGERLGQVSRSPLPSVQLGGRWQPSLLSRDYKEMLPRQGSRTQGPVGHKRGQGEPCGLSLLRAAWQVPTQKAHLKTEPQEVKGEEWTARSQPPPCHPWQLAITDPQCHQLHG